MIWAGALSLLCRCCLASSTASGPNVQLAAIDTAGVRLLGLGGTTKTNVGLLQVQTEGGSFGSVCGMNLVAADVVCRQLGFEYGTVALSPCSTYGATDLCAPQGTAVAMQDLSCVGGELAITECQWSAPSSIECLSHAQDSIVFCSSGTGIGPEEGAVRLLDENLAPSLSGKGRVEVFIGGMWSSICGVSSGAEVVLCRAMAFVGTSPGSEQSAAAMVALHEGRAPALGDVQCHGSESSISECAFDFGEDVYCAPSEATMLHCAGSGDTTGLRHVARSR